MLDDEDSFHTHIPKLQKLLHELTRNMPILRCMACRLVYIDMLAQLEIKTILSPRLIACFMCLIFENVACVCVDSC